MPSSDRPEVVKRVGGRLIAIVLGLVLIVAGGLKGHQWMVDPFVPGDIPAVPALRAAVVCAELTLGLWLLSGAYPQTARRAAVACFAVFLTVATRDALENRASCGCFGSLTVPPWATVVFDMAALAGLSAFAPPPRRIRFRSVALVALAALTVNSVITLALLGAADRPHLTPTPAVLELGTLSPGDVTRAELLVSNDGSLPVTVAEIRTSCPCLEVRLDEYTIQPGQTVRGQLVFDTTAEPDFAGGLSVSVTGTDSSGRTILSLTAEAIIRPSGR